VNPVPELELSIGAQSPFPDLAPLDAKNRFQMEFHSILA
jgi:predicted ATPase